MSQKFLVITRNGRNPLKEEIRTIHKSERAAWTYARKAVVLFDHRVILGPFMKDGSFVVFGIIDPDNGSTEPETEDKQ